MIPLRDRPRHPAFSQHLLYTNVQELVDLENSPDLQTYGGIRDGMTHSVNLN